MHWIIIGPLVFVGFLCVCEAFCYLIDSENGDT